MAGSSIGKGENSASIALKLEILNVIKRYSGAANQSNGFWLMEQALLGNLTKEFWVTEFEKDFPNQGEAIYESMVQWYSKTNIQQHQLNELEAEKKRLRDEAREKIEKMEEPDEPEKKTVEELKIVTVQRRLEENEKWLTRDPDNPMAKEVVERDRAELARLKKQ